MTVTRFDQFQRNTAAKMREQFAEVFAENLMQARKDFDQQQEERKYVAAYASRHPDSSGPKVA